MQRAKTKIFAAGHGAGTLLGALSLAAPLVTLADTHQGRLVQIVSPGQSIQAAIDGAAPHGWIFVKPGIYRETADSTNGLNISAAVNLIGLSTPRERVVVENSGNQLNGIVVVPSDRTGCMNCHTSMAPPFSVKPGVTGGLQMREPMIRDFSISGITIQGFVNNGLFAENLDGFLIDDVESVGNKNYGIFPTLSKNGIVEKSRVTGSADAGLWVETSKNVRVTGNLVEGNVIGMEISNSEDIVVSYNESRNNSVGIGVFLFAGLFNNAPGAKHITVLKNSIHDNNKANDAPPGALASELPSGTGLILTGADDSQIVENRIKNNNLTGIVLLDVCTALAGGSHDCSIDPAVTPEFLADQEATNIEVKKNIVMNNGTDPPPIPLAFAASDLTLLSFGAGNCFSGNTFSTSYSFLATLPSCK